MVPHYSHLSESDREENGKMHSTEVCVAGASADANPRTPEIDSVHGSSSSAAPVQAVQRQRNVMSTDFRRNVGQTDANHRTPTAGSETGPQSRAAPALSLQRSSKGLVIWNRAYRQRPDSDAEHGGTRPPVRRPVYDSGHERRSGFWSYDSNRPSWRSR